MKPIEKLKEAYILFREALKESKSNRDLYIKRFHAYNGMTNFCMKCNLLDASEILEMEEQIDKEYDNKSTN